MSKTNNLEVLAPVKVTAVATLKDGGDDITAKQLNKLFAEAQNGMRRIIALGLFAWEIKLKQLNHGQFGAWLAEHCPKLATTDSATGKPKATSQLNGYMDLTKSVLENVGFPTIEKYLAAASKFSNIKNLSHGGFLLIADKKVPDEVKPLREKIFNLVDGKTQRSLFLEFKQVEGDKIKKGRLKGQGGATKAQRASAAEREAQERITEKTLKAEEIADWLLEMSDDKGLGEIAGTPQLAALDKAMETARGYIKHQGGAK